MDQSELRKLLDRWLELLHSSDKRTRSYKNSKVQARKVWQLLNCFKEY